MNVVGHYPKITDENGLRTLKTVLDERIDKSVSTDTLIELTECVLKNNIFEHNNGIYKHLQGTAIGTKMAPLILAIHFKSELEEKLLRLSNEATCLVEIY